MTKKTYLIIALVLVAIVAGFIWWSGRETVNISDTVVAPADTTDAIQAELDAIDIGNLDAEFTDVDEAIKGL